MVGSSRIKLDQADYTVKGLTSLLQPLVNDSRAVFCERAKRLAEFTLNAGGMDHYDISLVDGESYMRHHRRH